MAVGRTKWLGLETRVLESLYIGVRSSLGEKPLPGASHLRAARCVGDARDEAPSPNRNSKRDKGLVAPLDRPRGAQHWYPACSEYDGGCPYARVKPYWAIGTDPGSLR